jgi:FAD:protein FMN transferase
MLSLAMLSVGVMMAGCARVAVVQSISGPTMGSTYQVKVVTDRSIAEVRSVVAKQLLAFDVAFSNWRDSSEIVRVNNHRSTEPLAVSPLFGGVLEQALVIADATGGAFDPTMKPLSDLYRAAKEDPASVFEDAQFVAAKQRVGYRQVSVEDGKLVKQRPDVLLDLDGIVAGAAADAIADELLALGIESFYLEITGEVLCRGEKPDGAVWRIGVVDPSSDASSGQRAIVTLPLRDRALCSSGDYRNAVVMGGRVVHHLFDPRTGRNPEHAVVSASVIADSCAVADALGTALMVLGDESGKELWPAMKELGAHSALFLKPGVDTVWREVKIEWPEEDS